MPTDPQGYPIVAWERISDNTTVAQILSDGTIVLITGTEVLTTDGDPNGIITAPLGSLAVDFTTPDLWQNQDAATTWKSLANPAPPPPSGVTSFNTRTGAVVSDPNDYAAVPGLLLGEGSFSKLQFLNGDTVEARGIGAKNTRLTLDGSGGTVGIFDGANSSIQFDGAGAVSVASLAGTVTISAATIALTTADLQIPTLPSVFANNAAAIGGGLVAGDVYRTGADPDVLCIVH